MIPVQLLKALLHVGFIANYKILGQELEGPCPLKLTLHGT
jgi:hypothetical protein